MIFCARVLAVLSVATSAVSLFSQAPAAPTNLTVTSADGAATLTWDAPANALTYSVYYSTTNRLTPATAEHPIRGITRTTYPVSGLKNGTRYYFVVTAVNSSGESAPTSVQTATPAAGNSGDQESTAPQQKVSGAVDTNSSSTKVTTNVGATEASNVQNVSPVLTPMGNQGPLLNLSAGTISYDEGSVKTLITNACSASYSSTSPTFDALMRDGSTYALINVLALTTESGAQTVKSNNWYIYSESKKWENGFVGGWKVSDFDGATRLYGAKKIVLLTMVLNDTTAGVPQMDYQLTVTQTQAANQADVSQLLGLVMQGQNAGLQQTKGAGPTNYWACGVVPVAYKTSSIKVDTSYTAGGGSPFKASQAFTNEGKERWDVSFALPVKKASALQYSSTAGTVTASQINKQSLFAVFDFYPVPVNLSATSKSFIPSFFGGVAMNSQPLHSLLFGASIGVHLAQVYAGALLLKQQQLTGLSTGSSGTVDQVANATNYAYRPSFSVGIKISIGSAASSLSKSNK